MKQNKKTITAWEILGNSEIRATKRGRVKMASVSLDNRNGKHFWCVWEKNFTPSPSAHGEEDNLQMAKLRADTYLNLFGFALESK